MRGFLGFLTGSLLTLGLVVGGLGVAAQGPTPTPTLPPASDAPFQTVRVDSFAYSVDPFYPAVFYITRRVVELEGEGVISAEVTFQPFVRDGEQMTAGTPFTTHESQITREAEVGQAWILIPQTAVQP